MAYTNAAVKLLCTRRSCFPSANHDGRAPKPHIRAHPQDPEILVGRKDRWKVRMTTNVCDRRVREMRSMSGMTAGRNT